MDSNTIDSVIVNDTYTEWKAVHNRLKPGGNLLIISTPLKYHRVIINAEDNGFEVRDMIQYIAKDGVYTIGLCRKPLSEKSVVENVIRWGVGGLNIDECRIATDWKAERPESWFNSGKSISGNATYGGNLKTLTQSTVGERLHDGGRFPANLIFECTCENPSTKPAPKSGHWPKGKTKGFGKFGGGESSYEGVGPKESGVMVVHTDPNCPCYILDKQSGNKTGQRGVVKGTEPSHSKKNNIYGDYSMVKGKYAEPIDELGGASRFFASFNTKTELLEYLTKLINPKNGMIYIATE
jgi:site-specific DNA-methyltransferase (adenine-specific)